jgi:hypothetical protein
VGRRLVSFGSILGAACVPLLLLSVGARPAVAEEGTHDAAPKKTKTPPPPSAPPAQATLHVTPGALGTPWTFELTNTDTTPLRVVTDGRLLTLDVTSGDDDDDSAHKKKPSVTHCVLPSELRPTTDEENARVLIPGITYVEEIDPRFYCFDSHDAAALTPGARVVARLGWPAPHTGKSSPPYEVDESFGGHDRSGVKELTAEAVTVPDTLDDGEGDDHKHKLIVTAPVRIDAERGEQLSITVSVENPTTRTVRLMLRPETLAFEVASPRGVYTCGWPRRPGAPIAEVFTTIPPHGKVSSEVLPASMCPDTALAKAGLYTVRARLDTRRESGKSIGIESFDGVVNAEQPTLVRLRRDRVRRP